MCRSLILFARAVRAITKLCVCAGSIEQSLLACVDPEGGQGSEPPPPPEKLQNIVFLSNTAPDPLKNHKATKPAFNVGPSSARQ